MPPTAESEQTHPASRPKVMVVGPAYLDRVLRVREPLLDPALGRVLDRSVDGRVALRLNDDSADGLELRSRDGVGWRVGLPGDWPGPWGTVVLEDDFAGLVAAEHQLSARLLSTREWRDDLGGMGAGYAAAFGGLLVHALGREGDATSQRITELLQSAGVASRPIRVAAVGADWTLLVTSAEHGDKLAVGFRGCHAQARWTGFSASGVDPDIVIMASWDNRMAATVLEDNAGSWRIFAPARRNMSDREPAVRDFAHHCDMICCNREEWNVLAVEDQAYITSVVPLVSVTDGAAGASLRYRPRNNGMTIATPAYPRRRPPRDTNRAGEAYASALIQALWDLSQGRPKSHEFPEESLRKAAQRASAAAALVLDRTDFGFPTAEEIDRALQNGWV